MFFFFYFIFGLLGLFLGFSFSFYFSLELVVPFSFFFDDVCFNSSITMHGIIMVFYGMTPLGVSLFYFMFYNSYSFFFYGVLDYLSFLLFIFSFFFVSMFIFFCDLNLGWTLYPPLSLFLYNSSFYMDLVLLFILMVSLSSIMGSMKGLFMLFDLFFFYGLYMSVFLWSFFVLYLLVIFSFPVFIFTMMMLIMDSSNYFGFFNSSLGGDPVFYQSLFWFFGHPEVYMLMLPVFAYLSFVSSFFLWGCFSYGYFSMIFSLFSIFFMGAMVWGHHMFVVGLSADFSSYFMAGSMLMSMPTGVKIFNWLLGFYSLWDFVFKSFFCYFWAFCFLLVFCFGGFSGVVLGNGFLDMVLHDTYFVVGHFHLVLSVSCMCGFFSFFDYVFFNSFFSFIYMSQSVFYFASFFFVVFFSLFFFLFHFLGFFGFPSSVSCFPYSFFYINFLISCFYFLGVGCFFVLFFLWFYNFLFFLISVY